MVYISGVNFNAAGNDHYNCNGEWVRITNSGSKSVSLSNWTLSDEGDRHTYRFLNFTLNSSSSVTVYTGNGSNTTSSLYWGKSLAVWNNENNGADIATLKDAQGDIKDQHR
ncbi:MAG: lamin tail domain-containing protein [Methanotrichaceae archaeon]|nr:lamin tail domain-containing protein [Methanotrichaceae archaeon]